MIVRRPLFKVERGLFLSVAAALWFFLASSAPHRVHHFFEQFPASAEHHAAHGPYHEHPDGEQDGHTDHQDRQPSQRNDCVVLSVAQNAQASVVQAFTFAVIERAVTRELDQALITASSFNPSPFSQRAPPSA